MNLDQIIDNIDQYEDNVEDLVRSLKSVGVSSFEEFRQAIQAAGVPVKKSLQNAVQDKFENAVVEDWAEAQDLNTEEGYMRFLEMYPASEYFNWLYLAIIAAVIYSTTNNIILYKAKKAYDSKN